MTNNDFTRFRGYINALTYRNWHFIHANGIIKLKGIEISSECFKLLLINAHGDNIMYIIIRFHWYLNSSGAICGEKM